MRAYGVLLLGLAVDLAVDPAVADSAKIDIRAGRGGWACLALNADFFPHHGRRPSWETVRRRRSISHRAHEVRAVVVTTAAAALTIAVLSSTDTDVPRLSPVSDKSARGGRPLNLAVDAVWG